MHKFQTLYYLVGFIKCSLKRSILFTLVGFIFIVRVSHAQEFGGNPWNINWQQINSDTARIIFPKGLENHAQRIANIVHQIAAKEKETIGAKHLKINIVLQNQTLIPNGYVGLAPWRSEFFMTPFMQSQELGSLPWHELLSIHEYRHVLQFSNSRRGLSKALYFLFGQSLWSASVFFAIPNWFWEGDAVVHETEMTIQGRGRLPNFFNGLNSLALSNTRYNYMKSRNGSYKDFVPDHYKYGYVLNIYGRKKYGEDFWRYVFADAARWEGLFYPFSQALKFYSGSNSRNFYKKCMQEYNENKLNEANSVVETPATQIIINDKKTVTNYRQPYFMSDNRILAFKESFKEIASLVAIDEQYNENEVVLPGLTIDDYYTFNNNKITWAETRFHERRGYKDYSVIVTYNFASGHKKKLTTQTKLFAPEYANAGNDIVALQTNPELKFNLVIVDGSSGNIKRTIPNPENLIYTYPRWSADDQFIYTATRNGKGEMSVIKVDQEGNHTELFPFVNHVIGPVYVTNTHIYFSASFDGSDQIHALRLSDNKIFQVTKRKQNVYEPSVNNDQTQLVFSEFNHKGNRILRMPLVDSSWKEITIAPLQSFSSNQWLPTNYSRNALDSIPNKNRISKKYSEINKAINIHSWEFILPALGNELGVSVISDNIVNTVSAQAQSVYNLNDFGLNSSINVAYARPYPIFFISGASTLDRMLRDTVVSKSLNDRYITLQTTFNEVSIGPGVSLPLNLSSGLYFRFLEVTGTVYYARSTYQSARREYSSFTQNLVNTNVHIEFTNARKKAVQNISRSWSQFALIDYSHTSTEFFQTRAEGDFVFPGIFPNDNLVVMAAGQIRNFNSLRSQIKYPFSDNFLYARGYNIFVPYDLVTKLSANYYFTLLYPDFGFANLAYLKRVRTNIFYDYSLFFLYNATSRELANYSKALNINQKFFNNNSLGLELIFDITLFNSSSFLVPFTIGAAYLEQPSFNADKSNVNFYIALTPLLRL